MKKIISIIFGAILIDQVTKGILLSLVAIGGWQISGAAWTIVPQPWLIARLTNWFNIVFTWNPGVAFSMMRGVPSWLVTGITGAIIVYLGYYLLTGIKHPREQVAMSLIVGGAMGNFIDRMRFGAVIDFIDWHVGTWHWPAFNVADICISVGVCLYLLHFIIQRKKNG